MRGVFLVGSVLVGLLVGAPAASAAVISVNTEDDSYSGSAATCSLREAITAANSNAPFDGCPAGDAADRDTIKLPAGEYRITRIGDPDDNTNSVGDFDVLGFNSELSIEPVDKKAKVVLSGNGFDRVIDQRDNSLLSLSRLHITDGDSGAFPGGAIRVNAGALSLSSATVSDSYSGISGGGIFVSANGGMDVNDSTIALNRTAGDGGGIALTGGSGAVIYNASIVGNRADVDGDNEGDGGGLFSQTVLQDGNPFALEIINTLLAKNRDLTNSGDVADQCVSTVAVNFRYSFVSQQLGVAPCLVGNGSVRNKRGANPRIGPILADNGGQTPTVIPLAGSPLIGAAGTSGTDQCLPFDQTGRRRPENSCDIGSVQYVSPPRLAIRKIRPKKKKISRGGKLRIEVVVRNTGDEPASRVRVCLKVKGKKSRRALGLAGATCRKIGKIAAGRTAGRKSFLLEADRRAREKAYRVTAKASAKGIAGRSKVFKVEVG